MVFKDREGKNLNRKRLEIVSQTPTQLVVDVFSAASDVTEYGTPINAQTLTTLQNEIDDKLATFEARLGETGATIGVGGQNVIHIDFSSDPQTQLSAKVNMNELFDLIYPVGSVYLSVNPMSPATLFSGIWEEYGAGRTLIGHGISDATYTAGDVGGESMHTLTTNEMPTHNHTSLTAGSGSAEFFSMAGGSGANLNATGVLSSSTAYIDEQAAGGGNSQTLNNIELKISSHNHTIENRGSGLSHNNMPPYIVCYMWKRIA